MPAPATHRRRCPVHRCHRNTPFGRIELRGGNRRLILAAVALHVLLLDLRHQQLDVGIVRSRRLSATVHRFILPALAAHPAWQDGHQNRFLVAITSVWISVPQIRQGRPVRR